MGKSNRNKMRNLDNINTEPKPIIQETIKHIDMTAIDERGSDFLGEILLHTVGDRYWNPGSAAALALTERVERLIPKMDPKDDMVEILRRAVVSLDNMNIAALGDNILAHPAFASDNEQFHIVKSSLSDSTVANLDETKVRYNLLKAGILGLSEEELAQTDTIPTATAPADKPSANNALPLGQKCQKCGADSKSNELRKVVLSDKAVPIEEHAQHVGHMVCPKCMSELQSGHAKTVAAALKEIQDKIAEEIFYFNSCTVHLITIL